MKRQYIPLLVTLLVILIDQGVKFYIKLNFYLTEVVPVFGNWFRLYFVENEGMAFGWVFPGDYGKLALTLFRILAVALMWVYVNNLVKKGASTGLIISISAIMAGALGNIVDSVFYGLIFSDSSQQLAELFPKDGGYGTLFHGKVVDMISIHLFTIDHVPDWVPMIGGKTFIFFEPIFNVADAAITLGVAAIILFQNSFFPDSDDEEQDSNDDENGRMMPLEGEEPEPTDPLDILHQPEVKPTI